MSRKFICAGGTLAVALFALAAFDGVSEHVIPGASAQEYRTQAKQYEPNEAEAKPKTRKRRAARQGTVSQQSKAKEKEISEYFRLYGGFIDPAINRQTPGGPFDSGFFFDSGIGRNGGQSPYMN